MPEHDPIAEEQTFLDAALAQRDRVVAHLAAEIASPPEDAAERSRQRLLRRQYEEIRRAGDGLIFGRLDGRDGTVRHIGRVGIRAEQAPAGPASAVPAGVGPTGAGSADVGDAIAGRADAGSAGADGDAEPLVVDWRAPVARAFYTATAVEPQGLSRRRHVRTSGAVVVGVDDEPLDGGAATGGLVGEGALLAALNERRTGHMTTAIATLQREQDDIIRAGATGPLIVQGGPGTGKTVVALHRVAYLLFTHRHIAEQAVLVLGPSTRFLDYIAQVLPALGETAVVSATCDALVPGIVAGRGESRAVAEIKGRAAWQRGLEDHVRSLLPAARELRLRWEGEFYALDAGTVGQMLASATQGRAYHRARTVFAEQVHQVLAEAVAEQRAALLEEMEEGFEDILARFDRGNKDQAQVHDRTGSEVDGLLSEEEIDELRERIADDEQIGRFIASVWPTREPGTVLRDLLTDPALVRRHVPTLSAEEAHAVAAGFGDADSATALGGSAGGRDGDVGSDGWAPSDIPLLDAVAELLGESGAPGPQGEFVADRARNQRDWVYGHVVVDEAQELSEMQWHMVLRRCPTRSITAVGDIDQAEAAHRHTSWAQAVDATLGDRWTAAELTVCYRTPREVMELTGPVLAKAGSRNRPPRAVRSSGIEPWTLTATPDTVRDVVAAALDELRGRWDGGTVGVVAPAALVPVLGDAITATQAKGLEWDAALVVDPDGIAAEPRGWNGLYVALTRCTQELGTIRVDETA